MMADYDTLILSDLHLGSEVSRATDALRLLQSRRYRQLVLLGDIFSDLNFRRLKGEHWQFLSAIRKLSNPRRRTKVVWVEGNHDHGLSNIMSHLVGVPVYQRYVWEYAGVRHMAVHGHQFDRFVSKNYLISRVGEQIYYQLQKIDSRHKVVTRHLDKFNTRWLRLTDKVARGAIHDARAGKVQRVFCGHTHVATQRHEDGISYYNSGSWVGDSATYITIGEEGVTIHEYDADSRGAHHRYPREERIPLSAETADLFEPAGLHTYTGYESLRC